MIDGIIFILFREESLLFQSSFEETAETEPLPASTSTDIYKMLDPQICRCQCNALWSYDQILIARNALYFEKTRAQSLQILRSKLEVCRKVSVIHNS